MRNRIRHLLVPALAPALALAIGLSAQIPAAQIYAQQTPEYGPANGTLLIAGGGVRDAAIFERFIELGGGAEDGRFIIVPTAGGNFDGVRFLSWGSRTLRRIQQLGYTASDESRYLGMGWERMVAPVHGRTDGATFGRHSV